VKRDLEAEEKIISVSEVRFLSAKRIEVTYNLQLEKGEMDATIRDLGKSLRYRRAVGGGRVECGKSSSGDIGNLENLFKGKGVLAQSVEGSGRRF